MKEEDRKKIEELLGEIRCSKNFCCAESGFENLCRAKDMGSKTFLLCLEENVKGCNFALCYGAGYICQCPVRAYLAKRLNK